MFTTTTAEPRWFLANLVYVHLHGDAAGGRLGVVEVVMPPGDEPPLHIHHGHDESFYVLEGELTLYLPGEERTLRAGEFTLAPRGVPHIYRAGEAGARALVHSSPAGFEAFVEEMSVIAGAAELPAPAGPPSPEQARRLTDVAATHGIEILGPPGLRP
jgi:quercetin dioxygenase-like cupin family protein